MDQWIGTLIASESRKSRCKEKLLTIRPQVLEVSSKLVRCVGEKVSESEILVNKTTQQVEETLSRLQRTCPPTDASVRAAVNDIGKNMDLLLTLTSFLKNCLNADDFYDYIKNLKSSAYECTKRHGFHNWGG